MRKNFHDQLSGLTDRLAAMCELAGQAMTLATDALLNADLDLAEQVIDLDEQIARLAVPAEEKALTLLALQAPVARDLRQVVSGIQIVADLRRMGALARHIAEVTRRRHPNHVLPDELAKDFTEMGRVAVSLTAGAHEVLITRDPDRAALLEDEDDAIDDLHSHLFTVVESGNWQHGVAAVVDVTLLGRFYERYADHAVGVARRVIFLATGKLLQEK